MTVSAQSPVITYIGNGSSTVYDYPFPIIFSTDLRVYFNNVEETTGFTVSGAGLEAGGSVTFTTAPASGVKIKLLRLIPLNRSTDYVEGGALRSEVLDRDFDRLVMMNQDTRADSPSLIQIEYLLDQTTDNIANIEANAAAALASELAAAASAATATTQAGIATTQAGIATTQAGIATAQASTATTQAGIATTQASDASTSATTATTQAGIATTQASTATTQAGNASTSASAASASASAAAGSASAAAGSASAASTSASDAAASAASLDTGNLLQLTGTQTVTGAKTFNDLTVVTEAVDTSTTKAASTAFADRFRSVKYIGTGATTATTAGRGAFYSCTGTMTVPASVFAAGDTFTIYNNSGSALTVTQGAGLTLRLVGTATTGNRTIAQRGMATVVFITATEAVISGGGLS